MALAPSPASVAAAREALAAADPALARAHASTPVFEWRLRTGGYEGLFRMIVEQQVSVAAAASIWKRVVEGLDGQVTPEAVLARDVETLRTFGLSGQKAKYGHEIARAHAEGHIDFDHLERLDDAEAIAALVAIKGVGKWTAETFLMFCEGRGDASGSHALGRPRRGPSERETGLCPRRDLAPASRGGGAFALGVVWWRSARRDRAGRRPLAFGIDEGWGRPRRRRRTAPWG